MELGDGTAQSRDAAAPVRGITDAIQVSVRSEGTCALRASGQVLCWGWGNKAPKLIPGLGDIAHIAAGRTKICGLRKSGEAVCWDEQNKLEVVEGLTGAIKITGGEDHFCALLKDGTASCWGENTWGQLGRGHAGNPEEEAEKKSKPRAAPVVGLKEIAGIASGHDAKHTCAVSRSGEVSCWGYNTGDLIGIGSYDQKIPEPRRVSTAADIVQFAMGIGYTVALRRSGSMVSWGADSAGGKLAPSGDGRLDWGASDVVEIAGAWSRVCALRTSGRVTCWGRDARYSPVEVSGLDDAAQIYAGEDATCAARRSGEVVCWGANDKVRFGSGREIRRAPAPIDRLRSAQSIALSFTRMCAATAAGSVECAPSSEGASVNEAQQVALGYSFGCAVTRSGQVACWGKNNKGQLGDGTTEARAGAVTATGIRDAALVAAGSDSDGHACAALKSGEIACWGSNDDGQLGDGSTQGRPAAVRVVGIKDASMVVAGENYTCALRKSGVVACWGDRRLAMPRDGSHADSSLLKPTPVPGLSDVVHIAAKHTHACAVRRSGGVACWGNDDYGRLGSATNPMRAPAAVPGIEDAISVAVGSSHSCAARRSGRVVCWGSTDRGQLGDGSGPGAPTEVPGLP
jgi:alpha-tubulin suppressor-like RCC1 family protein